MKLSEAIREGAKLSPQAFGAYRDGDGTCAMGAAWAYTEEHGGRTPSWNSTPTADRCPAPGCEVETIGDLDANEVDCVVHLNDDHRWTREAIADWLEGLGL